MTLAMLLIAACIGTEGRSRPVTPPQPVVTEPVKTAQPEAAQGITTSKFTAIPPEAEIIGSANFDNSKTAGGNAARELYVIDSSGGHITQITHGGDIYNHFAVSPNRKMIAGIRLAGDTNGSGSIDAFDKKTMWILDLENGKEWPLLPEWDTGWGGVDWSPDGRFIYFSVFRDKVSDIYRISYDGRDLQNITAGIELDLPFDAGPAKGPKWVSDTGVSPDGEWIVFLYTRIGVDKNVIAVCRTDGSQSRRVTDGGPLKAGKYGPWGAGDFDPEFSPDGTHIVFERVTAVATNFAEVPSGDIMTVKTDGTELKRLSPAGNTSTHGIADWSPDNRIVFSDWNKRDIYAGPAIVNAGGSGFHRLENARGLTWVRWIPPLVK